MNEVEIFEGNDFVLRMAQTYTHRFQCNFNLVKYPFDNQVIHEMEGIKWGEGGLSPLETFSGKGV